MKTSVKNSPVKIVVWSRLVTLKAGKAVWGPWVSWRRYSDTARNINEAVNAGKGYLKRRRVGTVVYIGGPNQDPRNAAPIWHAKFGTDGSFFKGWKANPIADMWRRRIN